MTLGLRNLCLQIKIQRGTESFIFEDNVEIVLSADAVTVIWNFLRSILRN